MATTDSPIPPYSLTTCGAQSPVAFAFSRRRASTSRRMFSWAS